MNYYTYFIKEIKVSNLVLSRDINRLESLNLERKIVQMKIKK